jgi:signal transduction histidine kinase
MTPAVDESRFDWRRGGAAAAALIAALVLLGMVFLVALSNEAREKALQDERRAYDVALLVRSVDSSISRSEAALGRFVLDEEVQTSGNIYYSQWRLAEHQITQMKRLLRNSPEQRQRIEELEQIFTRRGEELAAAARAASAKQGQVGPTLFYVASQSLTGPELSRKLDEIAQAERLSLQSRIEESRLFSAEADRLTDYLSWLGLIVGAGAIFLGLVAVQAVRQNAAARREAASEAERAEALERAVAERTQELREANAALRAEAEEREAAESQLRQVQKMEAVGQLTGGIAHDFNNMLAVVVGGIDLARRRLNGPRREIMTHLNNAMEGATRAAALTRRLLSFARSEPLLPDRVDPAELVGGMSDLLDRTIGERIQVEVELGPDLWPIYVDPHQLENAIVNLAVNARDAMDGTGTMQVSARNVTLAPGQMGELRAGDYVQISVTDTGCGMTPEVLERAFEPFFTTKPVGKGTGLGLSQIFGFAHQSEGEVGIESKVGEGTTVSIYLPRTSAGARSLTAPMQSSGGSDARVDGARILVVEDDPRVRSSTMGALQDLGYDPTECAGGAEAIRLFHARPFDLVISDVIMPEMTGPELIRTLKSDHDGFAVLFVTGYVGEGETDDLVGYELLRKPFTVSALASAVASALSRAPIGSRRTSEVVGQD